MSEEDIPEPPWYARHDEGWVELWIMAHRAMRPWDRVPHPHLVDQVDGLAERRWLKERFGWMAAITGTPGGTVQQDGGTAWTSPATHPATMSTVYVRVILGRDGRSIVTAIPLR